MLTYVGRDFALEAIQWVRWDNLIWQRIPNINNLIYKEIFSTIQMRIFFSQFILMTTSAIVLRKREKIIEVQWREIVNNY